MPEYISKDDAYRHFEELQEKHMKRAEKVKEKIPDYYERSLVRMNEVIDAKSFILGMPAADVVPVVHGKWENSKYMAATKCGVCGEDIFLDDCEQFLEWKYCPICGAKMDLEE